MRPDVPRHHSVLAGPPDARARVCDTRYALLSRKGPVQRHL